MVPCNRQGTLKFTSFHSGFTEFKFLKWHGSVSRILVNVLLKQMLILSKKALSVTNNPNNSYDNWDLV